jgi:hypothetical protein
MSRVSAETFFGYKHSGLITSEYMHPNAAAKIKGRACAHDRKIPHGVFAQAQDIRDVSARGKPAPINAFVRRGVL